MGEFDTVRECQKTRAEQGQFPTDDPDQKQIHDQETEPLRRLWGARADEIADLKISAFHEKYYEECCVASDDPRLKGN